MHRVLDWYINYNQNNTITTHSTFNKEMISAIGSSIVAFDGVGTDYFETDSLL